MYPLFELSKLITFGARSTPDKSKADKILNGAWKDNGERNIFALFFTNDFLILRYSEHGKEQIVKQLPWFPGHAIKCMCFDQTGTWLLCATETEHIYIIPALSLLNKHAQINRQWRPDDVTKVKLNRRKGRDKLGGPTCICWWQSLEGESIALIGTKVGFVVFVDLKTGLVVAEVDANEHVINLELVQDDTQVNTYALITTKSNTQLKLVLEQKSSERSPFQIDADLQDMGFEQIDTRNVPSLSILHQTDESLHHFLPLRFYQFSTSVTLSPQMAKGRHFVAAHDHDTALYKIFDSNMNHSPLFVYRVPESMDHVIFTDKLIFSVATQERSCVSILANQLAESMMQDGQEFNANCLVQVFHMKENEKISAIYKQSYPFYWHEKLEKRKKLDSALTLSLSPSDPTGSIVESSKPATKKCDSYQIQIENHTVLDGCLIVTNQAVYECRPRISPERLFLDLALTQTDISASEKLGIILGLDVNTLYEKAAHLKLDSGDYCCATKLFQLSKCSHITRVAAFAKYGRTKEVMNFLRCILANQKLHLKSAEIRQLSDLTLHCFLQQLLEGEENREDMIQGFREFLLSNFSYDEKTALRLLVQYGFNELLFELAKARGLLADTLEVLLGRGQLHLEKDQIDTLIKRGFGMHLSKVANGAFLQCINTQELVGLFLAKPDIAVQYISKLEMILNDLDTDLVLKIVELFDLSKPIMQAYLNKQMRRSLYNASMDEEKDVQEADKVNIQDLIKFFLFAVTVLNSKRGFPEPDAFIKTEKGLQLPEVIMHPRRYQEKRPLLNLTPVTIACGESHTGIILNSDLYTFGSTKYGRLGHGDLVSDDVQWQPIRVETLHMLQIKVLSVSCGREHTLAITDMGVYGWGNSHFGQVGVGNRNIHTRPILLEGLTEEHCISVSCGVYHSVALMQDCRVFTWGWGVHGQLGLGSPEDSLVPTHCKAADGLNISIIAAGYSHTAMRTLSGDVYTMGNSIFGQLGLGNTLKHNKPQKVTGLKEPIVSITTKFFHTLALTKNNRVYIWGIHPIQLRGVMRRGNKKTNLDAEPHLTPQLLNISDIDSTVSQVHCGSNFLALVTIDGEVYTWGKNFDGQLGHGNRQEQRDPTMVVKINDRRMTNIGLGNEHVIAIDSQKQIWGWGSNAHGQLGLMVQHENSSNSLSRSSSGARTNVLPEKVLPVKIDTIPKLARPLVAGRSIYSSHASLDSSRFDSGDFVEDLNIPQLSGTDIVKYKPDVIIALFKCIPQYCNEIELLRQSVDFKDWQTAAKLCLVQDLHTQAFYYHLKCLDPEKLTPKKEYLERVKQMVHFYMSSILKIKFEPKVALDIHQEFLLQVCEFWTKHSLAVPELEELLEMYMDTIAYPLFLLLNRKCDEKEKEEHGVSVHLPVFVQTKLSTKFMLQLTNKVLLQINQGLIGKDLLISFNPEMVGGFYLNPDVKPKERLISPEKLWQEIIQNIKKDSDTRSHVRLSTNEMAILQTNAGLQNTSDTSQTEETESEKKSTLTVLFTCGHQYMKESFVESIVPSFERTMNQMLLPETSTYVSSYYRRQGKHAMACPKCVLAAINTTSRI